MILDDAGALRTILNDAQKLLLDFDGPVCSVFAGFPVPVVASQLRDILIEGGIRQFPLEVQKTDDPSAHTAGVPVIGYANKPGKLEAFTTESPATIATSMATLELAVNEP